MENFIFLCSANQPLGDIELQSTKILKHTKKSVQKERTVKICLLILDLEPFRS